jgi:hypothetical protein
MLHRYLDKLLDTGGDADDAAPAPAPAPADSDDDAGGGGGGFRVFGRVARGAPVVAGGARACARCSSVRPAACAHTADLSRARL